MTKRKRDTGIQEDESATDSDNEQLSGSGNIGGFGSWTETSNPSEGSSTEGSSDRPLAWRIPVGKSVVVQKNPREVMAIGGMKKGFLNKGKSPKGKEKVTKGAETPQAGKGSLVGIAKDKGKKKIVKELRIPTRSCLGSEKGWLDTTDKFVNTPPDFDRKLYFKVYGRGCYHRAGEAKIPDDILKGELGRLEYINKRCTFDRDYLWAVRYAFQIPEEYEIKMPEEGEFIYHRGGDLWVGIPLEHFRAGLRLPMHRFFHTLLKDLRLGLGQLGPNSIRKICAFIARCTELGREPTLSLFWSLHKLQASRTYVPLFELHWKEGKALGGSLVEGPSTNKGWHGEFIFVRGGDLGYLPEYRKNDGVTGAVRRVEHLQPEEMGEAIKFAGEKAEGLWKDKTFFNVSFLIEHNREDLTGFVLLLSVEYDLGIHL